MSEVNVSHFIALKREDRRVFDRLTEIFGGKAIAVERSLEWAIKKGVPNDPTFPSFPQIHVHLSRNYRAEYEPSHLANMLHSELRAFWARYADGYTEPPDVWFWAVDLPKSLIDSTATRAFEAGKDPNVENFEVLRLALERVRETLPKETSVPVDIPTDKATRLLFAEVQAECDKLHLDVDTLLISAFEAEEKKRRPA